jgi:hypothetical protein
MSPVINYPGTHFSEIIADKLGYELVAYSRAGMSNGGIAIQLDTAIQQKPDLILLGTTYSDRIEFPINDPKPTSKFTIHDISYAHARDSISKEYDWLSKNPQLISTNLVEIISTDYGNTLAACDEPNKKEKVIRDWFRYLYHSDWKNQTDKWMMYAVLHQLHESNIPYIICNDLLNVTKICPWVNSHSVIEDITEITESRKTNFGVSIGYHTSVETQAVIAEYLISYMKEKYNV